MARPVFPRVHLHSSALSQAEAPVVATALRPTDGRPRPSDAAAALAAALGLDLAAALERASAKGEAGEVIDLPVTAGGNVERLLLVGTGDDSPSDLRRAGAALARRATGVERLATDTLLGCDAAGARAHLEGLLLAAYAFGPARGDRPSRRTPVAAVDLHLPGRRRAGVADGIRLAEVTARAVHLARDLANTPSNIKHPTWLGGQARALGQKVGLEVTVRDEKDLARDGFGGISGVGMGSARPPRLIEMSYRPTGATGASGRHVVLVGKGITFDSGGLSLKPREAMVPMKTDMAAGGAVMAVMTGLRDAGVRVRVTALVAAAENMPGAGALRPGDVITQYGGRTVEVFNTDAEGRLVLADALAYADAHLEPDLLVDMATLTGAASLGLGRRHGALFTADEDLAAGLLSAAENSGDGLWRMPLVEDYRPALDSEVADLSNISRDPHVSGGAIVAALFLREFVGARRWAHLDIAGPARAERDEHEVSRGGTGFGARLLLRWLEGL